MTTPNASPYAAIITITLPGSEECATANIILAPPDTVEHDGRTRLLRDCTLQDLRAAAATLEAEIWETYQAITLLELAEEARIEVALVHDTTVNLDDENWLERAVVIDMDTKSSEEASAVDAAPAEEPEPTEASTEVTRPAADQAQAEPETTTGEPAITEDDSAADESIEERAKAPTSETLPPAETEDTAADESDDIHIQTLPLPEPAADLLTVSEAEALERVKPRKRQRTAGIQLPEGHPTWMAVDVLIDEQPLHEARLHALSSMQREVAGVLVGPRPEKQPDGRYLLHITDSIIAKHTVMQGASVTYTSESWRYLNDELTRRYPEETAVIVGWYHTHPGFGIFLSGMDQFIHQNFFTQIWHVALVLDPHARTAGFFCWDRTQKRVSLMDFRWPSWAQDWS